MMHYLTAPYAIRLTKTARLFSDNGLVTSRWFFLFKGHHLNGYDISGGDHSPVPELSV
jgi:hypothetical protein